MRCYAPAKRAGTTVEDPAKGLGCGGPRRSQEDASIAPQWVGCMQKIRILPGRSTSAWMNQRNPDRANRNRASLPNAWTAALISFWQKDAGEVQASRWRVKETTVDLK